MGRFSFVSIRRCEKSIDRPCLSLVEYRSNVDVVRNSILSSLHSSMYYFGALNAMLSLSGIANTLVSGFPWGDKAVVRSVNLRPRWLPLCWSVCCYVAHYSRVDCQMKSTLCQPI